MRLTHGGVDCRGVTVNAIVARAFSGIEK